MFQDILKRLSEDYKNVDENKLKNILSCAYSLWSPEAASLGLPDFPLANIEPVVKIIVSFIYVYIVFFKCISVH